ncbi:hypothetical protein ETB97_006907 [Aspergillus alliaceus]|uniref:Uncharacterized protein n=1 Tax=Petromyces alliaceus TaxID=209559 RepID=A0A8H6EC19_PETAA|nr:hypothetical protein ETB97_006907 [Aspergillus burnettii]
MLSWKVSSNDLALSLAASPIFDETFAYGFRRFYRLACKFVSDNTGVITASFSAVDALVDAVVSTVVSFVLDTTLPDKPVEEYMLAGTSKFVLAALDGGHGSPPFSNHESWSSAQSDIAKI